MVVWTRDECAEVLDELKHVIKEQEKRNDMDENFEKWTIWLVKKVMQTKFEPSYLTYTLNQQSRIRGVPKSIAEPPGYYFIPKWKKLRLNWVLKFPGLEKPQF